MGTHWDALNFPEGKRCRPCRHVWKIKKNSKSAVDKHGRPYCINCDGMPSFFELKRVKEDSFTAINNIKAGIYQIIEKE